MDELDHGIEAPDVRIETGKDEKASLTCSVRDRKEEGMVIIIADDGKGIDLDKLQEIAAEKAEEARVWKPGTPMRWEAEEYHVKEEISKEDDSVVIVTPHLRVVLNKDEVEKIKKL